VSIAATPLVAMRVELEGLRASGSETLVELTLQISPEDRGRVGRNLSLQAVLTRGETTVGSIARTIQVDDRGRARIQHPWPAGTFKLRVDIESSGGGNQGIWTGEVKIPRFEPEPAPPPEPAAVEQALQPEPDPVPVAESPPAARSEPAEAAVAAATVAPPTVAPRPEAAAASTSGAAPKPLRGEKPVQSDQQGFDPGLAQLTTVVTDRSRPVPGLDSGQFRLRVDGKQVEIQAVGGSEVPVHLGFAADISDTMAPHLPELSRQLSRLALRTVGDSGELLLVTVDSEAELVLDWGASPSQLAQTLTQSGAAQQGDLVGLVTTSLAAFEGRAGRNFLIVVTDGGHLAPKSDWKQAASAVEAAGVQMMVIGFRGDWLKDRTRRQLERFATGTGGKSYFLPDTGMLQMTLDYVAEIINGSYSIQFHHPSRGSGPAKIRLETTDKKLELSYPKTLG
jgi:hypothetical protein